VTREDLLARLGQLLAERRADDGPLGVMLVRLQRLREFRIAHGFAASERMAAAVRELIGEVLRPGDELHQIDGGEFAVLLPRLRDRNHALLAGNRVLRIFQSPVRLGQREMPASATIGVSVAPDHGDDAETLLRRAEIAHGVALRGQERCAMYADGTDTALIPYELLRDAITGNRLEVHLQPILQLDSGTLFGAESLARWHDPERGAIPPCEFIPLAEDTGLITELTRWSLHSSLRHIAQARRHAPDLGLSLNLSPRVFGQRDIVPQILSSLEIWGVPPQAVTLEVTETALMEDPALSLRLLERLRWEGFHISIDDFGSGYSSLAYLKQFPATELKIDRAFVTDLQRDPRSQQLVQSIIDLGHHLRMGVLAEGVEDEPTLELLTRMGCDRAQGYFIQKPQPASDFISTLDRQVA
jgi:EAL domain-containing protein (putative c-di-GMP-specific phosphodiesterase class I)/GGDEF domain-containing protein